MSFSKRPYYFGECHFCICTACSGRRCPFKYKNNKQCYRCIKTGSRSARLDCDFFEHYLKIQHYTYHKGLTETAKDRTCVLYCKYGAYIGKYSKLVILQNSVGGYIKYFNIVTRKDF